MSGSDVRATTLPGSSGRKDHRSGGVDGPAPAAQPSRSPPTRRDAATASPRAPGGARPSADLGRLERVLGSATSRWPDMRTSRGRSFRLVHGHVGDPDAWCGSSRPTGRTSPSPAGSSPGSTSAGAAWPSTASRPALAPVRGTTILVGEQVEVECRVRLVPKSTGPRRVRHELVRQASAAAQRTKGHVGHDVAPRSGSHVTRGSSTPPWSAPRSHPSSGSRTIPRRSTDTGTPSRAGPRRGRRGSSCLVPPAGEQVQPTVGTYPLAGLRTPSASRPARPGDHHGADPGQPKGIVARLTAQPLTPDPMLPR